MNKALSNFGLLSITSLGLVLAAAACSSENAADDSPGGTGGGGAVGGTGSGSAGKAPGTGGSTAGTGTMMTGGTGGSSAGGAPPATGGATSGSAGTGSPAGGNGTGGGSGGLPATGGVGGGSGGVPTTGGAGGMGGSDAGGMAGTSGMAGSGGTPVTLPPLVTSATGAYWKIDGALTDSTAAATVTVNDTAAQKWDGFGGAFNELGWKFISALPADQKTLAMALLFSAADGANFAWGRIPMGASDYAENRYTLTDTTDPTPSGETNRPAQGTFSTTRDEGKLMAYVLAALAVKPDLKFWASPWTPPLWMKTGFKANSGADSSMNAKKPSFYDGGTMKNDDAVLTAYADYYAQFVAAYKAKGINIEIVSPQNEPGYDQNYPSALWDGATYAKFVGTFLGPKMAALTPPVKIMLGTLSNDQKDFAVATTAAADSKAKPFFAVIGAQWNTLDAAKLNGIGASLPVWATEHKCGNYPWNPSTGCGESSSSCPAYNNSQAPNDQAYGVESWIYIRNAIKTVKVTSYNAWNMVLDKSGLGIDTTRDWKQDALLVADGTIKPTPAYYVFRHMSQYVVPGASVVGATGGDALAWKNPDGSFVAVMFNSGAANPAYVIDIGGKKFSFAMPQNGWATVKYKP